MRLWSEGSFDDKVGSPKLKGTRFLPEATMNVVSHVSDRAYAQCIGCLKKLAPPIFNFGIVMICVFLDSVKDFCRMVFFFAE